MRGDLMFTNKQIFIQEYTRRMAEKYGRSVESSHPTERFLLLGEMVRDYASTNWKQTKEMVEIIQEPYEG